MNIEKYTLTEATKEFWKKNAAARKNPTASLKAIVSILLFWFGLFAVLLLTLPRNF